MVEQLTLNQWVRGSSPLRVIEKIPYERGFFYAFDFLLAAAYRAETMKYHPMLFDDGIFDIVAIEI